MSRKRHHAALDTAISSVFSGRVCDSLGEVIVDESLFIEAARKSSCVLRFTESAIIRRCAKQLLPTYRPNENLHHVRPKAERFDPCVDWALRTFLRARVVDVFGPGLIDLPVFECVVRFRALTAINADSGQIKARAKEIFWRIRGGMPPIELSARNRWKAL